MDQDKYKQYKNKYQEYKNKYLEEKNNSFINNLIWRRAEKHFEKGEVPLDDIESAIINAPTSWGIQPFQVIAITDRKYKKNLQKYCFNQPQIEECYCLYIFCAMKNPEKRAEEYVRETNTYEKLPYMLDFFKKLPSKLEWSMRQAYIALGYGLAAATEKKIASCPMEGFDKDKLGKELGLDENLVPCVLLTVGRQNTKYELPPRFRFNDIINRM